MCGMVLAILLTLILYSSSMHSSEKIAAIYQAACLQELQALKPGNVHMFAGGHDMDVMHFVQSAEVSSKIIGQTDLSVGDMVYQAVEATFQQVGMNTNLGIILLCAPLVKSFAIAQQCEQVVDRQVWLATLKTWLHQLTVQDAQKVAKAIVLANPAGLSNSNVHDVKQPVDTTLLAMMQYAQDYDRIAWQYAHDFSDIFNEGSLFYADGLDRWDNEIWATTWVYINFLATQLDSHIIRKYDEKTAQKVMQEAIEMKEAILAVTHPKFIKGKLLAWDAALKQKRINPGTSADLTVATLLVNAICKHL